jgi:Zn-dependent protease with chaperone function
MQIVLVLAVLAAIVISENSPCQPVGGAAVRLAVAGCAMLAAPLFAFVSSGLISWRLRTGSEHGRLVDRYRRMKQLHLVLWLTFAAAVAYGLDWARLVRFNWNLDRVFLADEFLILLPVLLPLLLSWAAFYDADRAIITGAAGQPFASRGRYVAIHARHYLGMLLIPLFVILAVQDAAQLLAPDLLAGEYANEFALAVFVPPLAVLLAVFPLLLRFVWQTRPLEPGPLRDRLETASRRTGIGVREILVWQTNSLAVNAAVAGFFPPLRYVFLTDGLLEMLSDEEIEGVLGHELGHVHHRHLLMRVIAMLAPLSLWFVLCRCLPDQMENFIGLAKSWGGGSAAMLGLLAVGMMGLYAVFIFGKFSRLLEKQADLFGCRCLEDEFGHESTDIFVQALEKIALASGNRRRWSWQHGSIAGRVEFLSRTAQSRKNKLHFLRRVRIIAGLTAALVVLPPLYLLLF